MERKSYILCFLPVIGDTKDTRRIELIQRAGFDVKVISFERDYFVARMPDCEIIKLPKIEQGRYFQRIIIMLKSFFVLRKNIKACSIVYSMSPDLAIFSFISGIGLQKPMILDVADIREIQVSKSIFGKVVRIFERFVVNRISLLIVTSKGFISEYYTRTLNAKIKDFLIIENKVDYNISLQNVKKGKRDKIRIGYFGYIRDEWTIELLKSLVGQENSKFSVFIAGVNMIKDNNLEDLEKSLPGFTYFGPYKSPKDLEILYSQIDIMAIFYPEPTNNQEWFLAKKICRSNRFYESCYFKKPILAFSFSEDGKEVLKYDIGFTLPDYDLIYSVKALNNNLNECNLKKWENNMLLLNPDVYKNRNEYLDLKNKITTIYNSLK